MVGTSKILTVSYGTFSCTLEGFDDPFSTMKLIAEYFRDLAADDRYFGAEPPTPDAEMLHRIAEREVKRRVEARLSASGVVLRQTAGRIAEAAEDDAPASAAPVSRAAPPRGPDSVSARLGRIRAVVDRARSEAAVLPVAPVSDYEDLVEEEVALADAEATAPEVADEPGIAAFEPEAAEPEVAEPDMAGFAGSEAAEAEDLAADEPEPEAAEPEVAELAEPEPADAEEFEADVPEAEPVAEITEDVHANEDEDAPLAASAETGDHADDIRPVSREWAAEADAAPEPEAEAEPEAAALADRDDDYAEADHAWAESDAMTADVAADEAPEEDEDVPATAAEAGIPAEETVEQPAVARGDDDAPRDYPTGGIAARILRLKRAELEQRRMDDGGDRHTAPVDEVDDGTDHQPAPMDEVADNGDRHTARVDEVEDGTDHQTAPVDEIDDGLAAGIRMALKAEADAIAREKKEARLERSRVLIGGGAGKEPNINRILEQTNSKMAETEGTRRRSAIAHLKAAVAATKADRLLKHHNAGDEIIEEQNAYRDDLAKAVRPRRSEPRENAADKRPEMLDDASAPLMLGSAQRVDRPDAAPAEQVRPRRIGAGMLSLEEDVPEADDDAAGDNTDFIAFAQRVGARDLPDLLEAAAAYTAFVERQPTFSRPQIMRRAASFETDEEFTREAGLRSFGQLLRQGKIRKLQRGQFTISEDTRFKPETRVAGE